MADLTNTTVLDGANVDYTQNSPAVTVLSGTGDNILTIDVTPSAKRLRDGKKLNYVIKIQNTDAAIDATDVAFTDTYATANYTVTDVSADLQGLTFDSTTTPGTITSVANFTVAHGATVTITIKGTVKYTA